MQSPPEMTGNRIIVGYMSRDYGLRDRDVPVRAPRRTLWGVPVSLPALLAPAIFTRATS